MARYRDHLPIGADTLFLTDGGIETVLIFHRGIELPEFAAFVLLESPEGREVLKDYYRPYLSLAREHGTGFVLESPTWRSNPDWGARLGYGPEALDSVNRHAIALLVALRSEFEDAVPAIVLSGCIGPRGDGYVPRDQMTAGEAEAYHRDQIETFASTEADLVAAITIPYVDEAVGIARAARAAGMPSVISFTVETDGRLPSGDSLRDAVERVDAETDAAPAYYMINCAHPEHFADVLTGEAWTRRIRGLRANASTKSHAELDAADALDAGDPDALGRDHVELAHRLKQLSVVGGCCGTDERHVAAICRALLGEGLRAPAGRQAFS
ncbi:MAG: homocysteine S-methyltransferase family protein [Rhodothermales bacterium]|nr:homocysteine S-methyltransferase family protein [Rhodothermales bacterium]